MKKTIDWIANVYFAVAMIGLLSIIGIMTVEIFSRYFIHSSMTWSHEFMSILMCWVTFLGFGKIAANHEFIMVTFLPEKLSPQGRKILSILNSFLMLVTSIIILTYTIKLISIHINRTTRIMSVSSAWYYFPMAILMVLVVVISIRQLSLAIRSKYDFFSLGKEE